jgi:hypothetical protein
VCERKKENAKEMKKTSEKLARSLANADVLVWKKERKK